MNQETPHDLATRLYSSIQTGHDISLEYSKLSKSELQYAYRYLQKKFQHQQVSLVCEL